MTRIHPYRGEVPDQELADLRNRLAGTRWAPEPACGDKGYGVPVAAVRELAAYWLESYDWRGWEARINAHDQFTTTRGYTVEAPHYPTLNVEPISRFLPRVLANHTFDENTVPYPTFPLIDRLID
jgi:hypothetical protein